MPLDFTLLRLMFNVLKQPSSVSSPYKRSSLFLTRERCSYFENENSRPLFVAYCEIGISDHNRNLTSFNSFPISSGISIKLVLSNFNHRIPVIRRTDSGNLPSCEKPNTYCICVIHANIRQVTRIYSYLSCIHIRVRATTGETQQSAAVESSFKLV